MPTARTLARVRAELLAWYGAAQRDFPWRRTRDPYPVLVSEVMLQQTQASRVVARFERFMARFPSAQALAAAPSAAVLAEWSGLGYNRRALSLQRAAASVTAHGWPDDVAALRRLPGVGPYTARAIASLAFGQPVGVVDTNVRRWLVRRFRVDDRATDLQVLADALATPATGAAEAAAWTHATMEFGAAVCRSRAPRCAACPIARGCSSRGAAPRVAVQRQPSFPGSSRARRGAVLRALAVARGHELDAAAVGRIGGDEQVLADLEDDGLVHRRGRTVRLGDAEQHASAATIGS